MAVFRLKGRSDCARTQLTRRVERCSDETTNSTGYQVVQQLSLLGLDVSRAKQRRMHGDWAG